MTTNVTRPCFTTQHQTCKTKTDFLVSDRSCPKTDGRRLHHCHGVLARSRHAWFKNHATSPVVD